MTTTKKCPMCAEQIPSAVVLCPLCGTRFEENGQVTPPPAGPVKPPSVSPPSLPAKKSHAGLWIAVVLVLVVILGALGALLWTQRFNIPGLSGLLATSTSTVTPTLPPTVTSTPSPTPDRQATVEARIESFAGPILSDIGGRPPSHETDFSTYSPKWGGDSEVTFKDGVMHMRSTDGNAGTGGEQISGGDFVLKFEFTPIEMSGSDVVVLIFHQGNADFYDLSFSMDGSWYIYFTTSGVGHQVSQGQADRLRLGQKTTVHFIVRGEEMAFYLNGQPVYYGQDDSRLTGSSSLRVFSPTGSIAVDFDNIKFWDLNDLQP